jgi:hypothetical protein
MIDRPQTMRECRLRPSRLVAARLQFPDHNQSQLSHDAGRCLAEILARHYLFGRLLLWFGAAFLLEVIRREVHLGDSLFGNVMRSDEGREYLGLIRESTHEMG